MATDAPTPPPDFPTDDFVRVPGLFQRWEVEELLDAHHDLLMTPVGRTGDGAQLFHAYRRSIRKPEPPMAHLNEPSAHIMENVQ